MRINNLNKLVILILLVLALNFSLISAKASEEYISEFNIKGESCDITDAFIYDISDPIIFNEDNKFRMMPVIYSCCLDNKECVSIIFDINNKDFINDYYMKEIIDLNYIRYNLHNGNLSENYFDIKGLDLCNYFTLSDLKGESLNLASEIVESGALMVQTEKAYQVSKTVNTARKIGVIGKFNPTIFISSVEIGRAHV